MEKINEIARAKVNLTLDIIDKLENGYHLVEMIMQQIDIKDEIEIQKIDDGIIIESSVDTIPVDHTNLAYKAAKAMMDTYGISDGVKIHITKNIPIAAGLAGGSSDAAAVIRGMNKLFDLKQEAGALKEIGLKLGADIPFCIEGGCSIARGIGEELENIKGLEEKWLLVVKPSVSVSTKEVYEKFDLQNVKKHPNTLEAVSAIESNDITLLEPSMYNVLEEVTVKMHPVITKIRKDMITLGAMCSMMSGSGPTVFGFFRDYEKAKEASDKFTKEYKEVFVTRTYSEKEKI